MTVYRIVYAYESVFVCSETKTRKKWATTSSVEIEAKKKKENRETEKMASKSKKQLLKIVPDDKIVFNPPFTRLLNDVTFCCKSVEFFRSIFRLKTRF